MILNAQGIHKLLENKHLVIGEYDNSDIEGASIKLYLSSFFIKYKSNGVIDTKKLDQLQTQKIQLPAHGYYLEPGDLLMSELKEEITMPQDYIGWLEGSGSLARIGLQIGLAEGHIDPGYSGKVRLELKNMTKDKTIIIYPGMYVCKLYIESILMTNG